MQAHAVRLRGAIVFHRHRRPHRALPRGSVGAHCSSGCLGRSRLLRRRESAERSTRWLEAAPEHVRGRAEVFGARRAAEAGSQNVQNLFVMDSPIRGLPSGQRTICFADKCCCANFRNTPQCARFGTIGTVRAITGGSRWYAYRVDAFRLVVTHEASQKPGSACKANSRRPQSAAAAPDS